MRGASPLCCCRVFIGVICLFFAVAVIQTVVAVEGNQFLYAMEEPDKVFPVIEYQPPEGTPEDFVPDFLSDPNYPNARIVEFYAHWCPHCQHLKPKYIEFARELNRVKESLGPNLVATGADIEVHAISCVPHKILCQKFKVKGYPTVNSFPAFSQNYTKFSIGDVAVKKLLNELGVIASKGKAAPPAATEPPKPAENAQKAQPEEMNLARKSPNQAAPHFLPRTVEQVYQDAHLSLDFVLKHGIYVASDQLSPDKRDVLDQFIRVGLACLPESSTMTPLFKGLKTNFASIASGDEHLQEFIRNHPPPTTKWSPACTQHGTGYTCGLWTLFHILTVGLVEHNTLVSAANGGASTDRLTPHQVAEAIRNFLDHFFQCEVCRLNFLQEYDACGHDRCNRLAQSDTTDPHDWKQLPLWLYETHNGVNTRLRSERLANKEAEDTETEWEAQWPAVAECPSCWLSEGRWDEDHTFAHLRLQYWPEDHETASLKALLQRRTSQDLHPDVIRAAFNGKYNKDVNQTSLSSPTMLPQSVLGIVVMVILFGYGFQRKRTYDRKGYHKKLTHTSARTRKQVRADPPSF